MSNPRVTRESILLMISESTATQFSLMFRGHRGSLRCRIQTSFVEDFKVESDSVFVDVLRPEVLIALSNLCLTRGSSFVDDL